MPRNIVTASTTWDALCSLSRSLCNTSEGDELREGLVWIANNSIGGRECHASRPIDEVDNGFGAWLGYTEEGAERFWWKSASSGATIEATREGSLLRLHFEGDDAVRMDESYYLALYALAIELDDDLVTNLGRPEAAKLCLKYALGHLSEGYEKIRAFAERIGIEL
ncbi:MAG TPA: hypothetical protein VFQ60_00820 [Patescibacteria group bacterium]|nr:hypothetical protein [Patescibacteria group bacterium]